MAILNKNKKITKIKKTSFLNIGTLMFGIVFLYMIICTVIYLTRDRVTSYEVTAGSLAGNYRFSALALKEEVVINAEQAGQVTYYVREGGKIGNGSVVYTIGGGTQSTGETGEKEAAKLALDAKNLSKLRSNMALFANSFDTISFQNVYNFKADTESSILEMANESALSNVENATSDAGILGTVYTAPQSGVVVYGIDGYEDMKSEDVTTESFDQKNYQKKNLRLSENAKAGEPVYKLVTDEYWSLMIPMDVKMATELVDQDVIRFRFLKDGNAFNANFSIVQNGENFFGKLDVSNSVIRYSGDRFVDIELVLNREAGLKIPNSSIAEKSFYTIPEDYVIVNEESDNEISLLREYVDAEGNAVKKYVTATVYKKIEEDYYIDKALFKEGDYVVMKDSSKKFQISETQNLQGVYNINKGYAVFREVKIIDYNEEYSIVEAGSSYGLSQYDHIVLDAASVNDEDIVY